MPFEHLPIQPGFPVMEARAATEVPQGPQWLYEPKWDGFRALVFRDGTDVEIRSKTGQSLSRYFPEIVRAVARLEPARIVFDGEIMVRDGDVPDFDLLLQRIHPAESRVRKLAAETPAGLAVFDVLVAPGGKNCVERTLEKRRTALEEMAFAFDGTDIALSPATRDRATALVWLAGSGRGSLDGVVAKRLDMGYRSGARDGMVKVKRAHTADCVVAGYRRRDDGAIASLLLGLYDGDGLLHHVGFCSALTAERRTEAGRLIDQAGAGSGFTGRAPGGPSRWRQKEEPWFALSPHLVIEVQYDQITGRRFRHGARFVRWRADKEAAACTFAQIGA